MELRRSADRLAFAAPPLVRTGAVEPEVLERVVRVLGIRPEQVVASQWVVNGPEWIAVLLAGVDELLAVEPGGLDGLLVGAGCAVPARLGSRVRGRACGSRRAPSRWRTPSPAA